MIRHPLLMHPADVGTAWRYLVTLADSADRLTVTRASDAWAEASHQALDHVRRIWSARLNGDERVQFLAPLFQRAEAREMPGIVLVLHGAPVASWLEEAIVPLAGRFVSLCGGLQNFLEANEEKGRTGRAFRAFSALESGDVARLGALMAASDVEGKFALVRLLSIHLMTRLPMLYQDLGDLLLRRPHWHPSRVCASFEESCARLERLGDELRAWRLGVAGYDDLRVHLSLLWFRKALERFPDSEKAYGMGLTELMMPVSFRL